MKTKTAEQILKEHKNSREQFVSYTMDSDCLKAMEEYANQSKWVSVEESGFPEPGERVLCYSESYGRQIGWRKHGGNWEFSNGGTNTDKGVLFYQPLPPHPKH